MESSPSTQEVENSVLPATSMQDIENVKSADSVPPSNSNVDETKPGDLVAQESMETESGTTEVSKDMSAETSEVTSESVSSSSVKEVDNNPVRTDGEVVSTPEPQVDQLQLNKQSETESEQKKADEHMECQDATSPSTEVGESVSKDVSIENPQSIVDVTTPADGPEPISTDTQQSKDSTETVETTSAPVPESDANADIEVINVSPEVQNELAPAVKPGNPGSLSLLAEMYDSGNDSDVCEVPSMQNYQDRVVEINSDTESSSSSSDDDEDNEPIDVEALNAAIADDDEEEAVRSSKSPRVKGEFHLDDLPPIHELQITVPEEECTELGKIQSIVEQLVIVNSLPGTVPLDLDTVLFLDKGKKVLGEVFDVLGQVSDPLYCVRFNSNKDIKNKGIEVGQMVYVAPRTQHTQFVILANLMKERGSDASWEYDIEPPERYLDYSDDEEERSARRSIRNKNRPVEAGVEGPKRNRPADAPPYSGPRPYRGNHHGGARMQHFPDNYRIAGSSWHSNFSPNYNNPQQQQFNPYRPPPRFYRPPVHGMPVRPPAHGMPVRPPAHDMPVRPPAHPGMVVNPYAIYPPPHLMQQPLFPPPTHQPPPPAPPGPHGGY